MFKLKIRGAWLAHCHIVPHQVMVSEARLSVSV